MSRMRDMIIEIQDEIERGTLSYEAIARTLDVPVKWVLELAATMDQPDFPAEEEYPTEL